MKRVYIEKGVDILGDGHGCLRERVNLIEKAGYIKKSNGLYYHPNGRKLIYLNDEANKGWSYDRRVLYGEYPSVAMMLMMKEHVEAGLAYAVTSNNNEKICRFLELELNRLEITHSLESMSFARELREFEKKYGSREATKVKEELLVFCRSLPSYIILANQEEEDVAVITHAGILDNMIGKDSEFIRKFCAWGGSAANVENWVELHQSNLTIIWGHKPQMETLIQNNTINIDTAGYFGNKLTMLRYPEMAYVQEKVETEYEVYQA